MEIMYALTPNRVYMGAAWQSHNLSTQPSGRRVLVMPFLKSRTEPTHTITGTVTKMDMPCKPIPYGFLTGFGIPLMTPQVQNHEGRIWKFVLLM